MKLKEFSLSVQYVYELNGLMLSLNRFTFFIVKVLNELS